MDQTAQAVRDGILEASKIERRRHSVRAVIGVVLVIVIAVGFSVGVQILRNL